MDKCKQIAVIFDPQKSRYVIFALFNRPLKDKNIESSNDEELHLISKVLKLSGTKYRRQINSGESQKRYDNYPT